MRPQNVIVVPGRGSYYHFWCGPKKSPLGRGREGQRAQELEALMGPSACAVRPCPADTDTGGARPPILLAG
jgi:hypothetical protein